MQTPQIHTTRKVRKRRPWKTPAAKAESKTPLRPRKCVICGTRFRPTRRGVIYCSVGCRQKSWRDRQRGKPVVKLTPEIDPTVEPAVCWHCGSKFWARPGKNVKYCKPSCRTLASRSRRLATIAAFCQHSHKTMAEAEDFSELPGGLKAMQTFLIKKGLLYEQRSRAWLPPPPPTAPAPE
jgi:hypothetical protein